MVDWLDVVRDGRGWPMDSLRRLVQDAVHHTMVTGEHVAVLTSDATGHGVLWLVYDHNDGMHVQVVSSRVERGRHRPWRRIGKAGKGDEPALERAQKDALERLGFIAGFPDYEREIPAHEMDLNHVTNILLAVLREVLAMTSADGVTIEFA